MITKLKKTVSNFNIKLVLIAMTFAVNIVEIIFVGGNKRKYYSLSSLVY